MLNLFQYSFIVRGLEAGLIVGVLAPLIGAFLVLRRYSMIADTLAHVSLAGVAIGLLLRVNALVTAIVTAVVSSVFIERLRQSRRVYGESALSIFLSGSLAVAIVLIGLAHGFNVDLFSYLFGSIVTVRASDVWLIGTLGILTLGTLFALYKELVFISFDEESARVSGIPTRSLNVILIGLAALTVAVSIPIVGALLIAALMVIPVVTALQLRLSFRSTVLVAVGISVFSVVTGIVASFYLNLAAGGAIVLVTLLLFGITYTATRR